MRIEGNYCLWNALAAGIRNQTPDHCLVSPVHTIKIADGQGRTLNFRQFRQVAIGIHSKACFMVRALV